MWGLSSFLWGLLPSFPFFLFFFFFKPSFSFPVLFFMLFSPNQSLFSQYSWTCCFVRLLYQEWADLTGPSSFPEALRQWPAPEIWGGDVGKPYHHKIGCLAVWFPNHQCPSETNLPVALRLLAMTDPYSAKKEKHTNKQHSACCSIFSLLTEKKIVT